MTSSTSSFKVLGLKVMAWLAMFLAANAVAREPVLRLVEQPARLQMASIAKSKAPLVLLGDSHAAALGDSDDKLLNLARAGDSLAEMRAKLRYLLRQGYPVRKVVLSLPWHSFSAGRAIRNNRQQGELFTDAESYQEIYEEAAWRYWLRTQVYGRLPLLNPVNARLARRYLRHRVFPENSEPPWESLSERERQAQSQERWLRNYGQPYDPEQTAQLDGLVADCRKANLPLTLIRLPVTPEYQHLVVTTDEFREGQAALSERRLQVVTWDNEPAAAERFANQDHLVRYGVVARQIRQELERLEP